MQAIMHRHATESLESVPDVAAIIEKEELACAERIEAQVRPILVKEFRRVAKRYKVEKVIFGNGTCLILWDDKKWLGESHVEGEWPPGLRRFVALCESVASTYPPSDITQEDL
jgi:hypothetical protein